MTIRLLAVALGTVLALSPQAQAQSGQAQSIQAAWTQIMGSDGPVRKGGGEMPLNLSLRVITADTADCTGFTLAATIPGQTEIIVTPKWTVRSNQPPAREGFNFGAIAVCQTEMDEDWASVRLLASDQSTPITVPVPGGAKPVPVVLTGAARATGAAPRMVVFGDSGCRGLTMTTGRGKQDCARNAPPSSETRFFFEDLARKAMSYDPDVVIHLGDYRYDKEGIRDWDNWNSDFFSRVASGPLMQVPWAFVRGNHETCDRAGHGWYYFFGPNDDSITCSGYDRRLVSSWYFDLRDSRPAGAAPPHRFIFVGTGPSIVSPGGLILMDCGSLGPAAGYLTSAQLWDRAVCEFRQSLNWSRERTSAGEQIGSWLVMHKPLWGLDTKHHTPSRVDRDVGEAFEAALSLGTAPECAPYQPGQCGLKAVLAAHEHMFTNVVFPANALPQQYVVGHSGVRLDGPPGPVAQDNGPSTGACKHYMASLGMAPGALEGIAAEYRGRFGDSLGENAFGFVFFERDTSQHSGWAGTVVYVDDQTQKLRSGADFDPPSTQLRDCRRPYPTTR